MAKKNQKSTERQFGKTKPQEKKPLIDPKYKNTFWTGVTVIILIIFFIINNTRFVPEQGAYPPRYNASTEPAPDSIIPAPLRMETNKK
jgi:hypothetical protein